MNDLPMTPAHPTRTSTSRSAGGWPSTGMADESERGARNGSLTDVQAHHMSAPTSPFDPRFSLAFHARAGIKGGTEEEAATGPAGKWQSARHQKGWQSINPTVRNKQRSVPTFHSIGHLSLRRFESLSIRERLDRMSGMVSTCPSSKCYASSADP